MLTLCPTELASPSLWFSQAEARPLDHRGLTWCGGRSLSISDPQSDGRLAGLSAVHTLSVSLGPYCSLAGRVCSILIRDEVTARRCSTTPQGHTGNKGQRHFLKPASYLLLETEP